MDNLFEGFETKFHDKDSQIKPFLKWAGGKFRLLEDIKSRLPQDRKRYIEPFMGGGSVTLNVDYPEMIVSDVNADLVNVYVSLRDLEEEFIGICEKIFNTKPNNKDTYYKFRDEFNATEDQTKKAAIFIYLNKHCFNGLCRYNSKGAFNTPIGGIRTPKCPSSEMRKAIPKLKKIDFRISDFKETLKLAGEGDLVYCDPPYLPISTKSFVQYSKNGFTLDDQIELARLSEEAANRGAFILLSNHDTSYSRELYKKYGASISSISVRRSIGGENAKRGEVPELLASFEK